MGETDAALAASRTIDHPDTRDEAHVRIVEVAGAERDAAAAVEAASAAFDAIDNPSFRPYAMARVAEALVDAGDTDSARVAARAARAAADPSYHRVADYNQAERLIVAAEALASAGDKGPATEAANAALAAIDSVDIDKEAQVKLLVRSAAVLADVGDEHAALSAASAALTAANTHGDNYRRAEALLVILDTPIQERLGLNNEPEPRSVAPPSDEPPNGVSAPHKPSTADSDEVPAARPVTQNSAKHGCYIATAVYGSYESPEVWVLRRWRDQQLASTTAGRQFIRLYYAVSPAVARTVGGRDWFTNLLRRPLDILVDRLAASGYSTLPYSDS